MKTIISLGLSAVLCLVVNAKEKDVWYDADGKVVKITPAEKEKKVYTPDWKKREQERRARMEVLRLDKSSRSRSSRAYYADPYASYYSSYGYRYGYTNRSYYSPRWRCSPASHYRSGRGHSSFRFQGTYRGSSRGWSVRARF